MDLIEFSSPSQKYQEELGRGLAELHKNSSSQFGFDNHNYCGLTPQLNEWKSSWADFYLENRLGYLWKRIESQRPLSTTAQTHFHSSMKNIRKVIQDDEKPSLIHGDLWSGNAENSVLGPSIFDPAAYYGHREAELGMMFLFGGFSNYTIAAYEEVFPLRKAWKDRLDIYKLYHLLNHHLLFGGGYASQAMSIVKKYA